MKIDDKNQITEEIYNQLRILPMYSGDCSLQDYKFKGFVHCKGRFMFIAECDGKLIKGDVRHVNCSSKDFEYRVARYQKQLDICSKYINNRSKYNFFKPDFTIQDEERYISGMKTEEESLRKAKLVEYNADELIKKLPQIFIVG